MDATCLFQAIRRPFKKTLSGDAATPLDINNSNNSNTMNSWLSAKLEYVKENMLKG